MALPLRMNINTALTDPTASSLSSHDDELVNVDATPTPSTPQTPPTPDMAGNLVFNRIPSLQLQQGGGGGSTDHNMLKRKSGSNCKCFPLPLHYANSSGATACSWMNNSCGTVGAEDGGGGHPYSASCVYASCAYPPVPSVSLSRKIGAEFIGTFILIFAGTASAIVNEKTGGSVSSVGLAASAGLAVMIVILATGHISGAHLNPSLTVAFAALRHFPWIQVPAYVSAQLMASVCAAFVLKGVFHPDLHGGVTVPSGAQWQAFILEFIISFNLMFVVTAVATDTRAVGELAGIAVGATVTMNILIAGATTGASMNPVRTLGPAIASKNFKALWVYMVGPIFGALAGAAAYTLVRLKGEEDGSSTTPRRSFRR